MLFVVPPSGGPSPGQALTGSLRTLFRSTHPFGMLLVVPPSGGPSLIPYDTIDRTVRQVIRRIFEDELQKVKLPLQI